MELLWLVVEALIPTAILSRILLWAFKWWLTGHSRILVASALTWAISVPVAAWIAGEFRGLDIAVYGVATAFWARIDIYRLSRK